MQNCFFYCILFYHTRKGEIAMSVSKGCYAALVVLAAQANFLEGPASTPATQPECRLLEKATVQASQSSSQAEYLFFLEEILQITQRLQRFA